MLDRHKYLATLIFMALAQSINTSHVLIDSGTKNLPGHVYRLTCNSGCTITALLTWSHNADLQLYLYNSYQNALSDQYYLKLANSGSKSNQSLSYGPTTNFGYFYIRVQLYSMSTSPNDYLLYNLVLSGTGSNTFANYMFKSLPEMTAVVFVKTDGCRLRINYNLSTPISNYIVVYSPSRKSTTLSASDLQNQLTMTSTQIGDFVVAFSYSSSVIINSLYSFTYSLEYETDMTTSICCQSGYNWDSGSKSCIQQKTNTPASSGSASVVGIVIGCLAATFAISILIAVCCYKKWKMRQRDHHSNRRVNSLNNSQENSMQQINFQEDLSVDITITCSICLDNNCNATLPCKHNFHKDCIKAWMVKNKMCPLCRGAILNSKIIKVN